MKHPVPRASASEGSKIHNSRTELRRLQAEMKALERAGKLDAATRAQYESRMLRLFRTPERQRKLDEHYASLREEAIQERAQRFTTRFWSPILIYYAGGLPCFLMLHEGFIHSPPDEYYIVLAVVCLVLVPLFYYPLWLTEDIEFKNEQQRLAREAEQKPRKSPFMRAISTFFSSEIKTWWMSKLRTLMVAITGAAFIFPATTGWLALLIWALGPPQLLPTTILETHYTGSRKYCSHETLIAVGKHQGEICLENRLNGRLPKVGETVTVFANISSLGVYVKEVHTNPPAP